MATTAADLHALGLQFNACCNTLTGSLKFLRRQQKKRFLAILFRLEKRPHRPRTHQQTAGDNDDKCTETLVLCAEERTRESQGSRRLAATTPCPAGIIHVDPLTHTLSGHTRGSREPKEPVLCKENKARPPRTLNNVKHRLVFSLLIPAG
jgi:hypothetical protein